MADLLETHNMYSQLNIYVPTVVGFGHVRIDTYVVSTV